MRALLFALIAAAPLTQPPPQAVEEVITAGRFLDAAKLCAATGGNISVRADPQHIAITVSGVHKGQLTPQDIILVNMQGAARYTSKKPSAETLLHIALYAQFSSINAVVHHHTQDGVLLSFLTPGDTLTTTGYELHKIFPGITTHESQLVVPIFDNSQDYPTLSRTIATYLQDHPNTFGYLIRGHGFTTWGQTMQEAKIRVEAFEYLFGCELRRRTM